MGFPKDFLLRLDSGNDAKENLGILLADGAWFVIKRNPRSEETKVEWFAKVKDIRDARL